MMLKKIVFILITLVFLYAIPWLPWMLVKATADIEQHVEDLPKAEVVIVFGGLYEEGQEMSETNRERLLTSAELLNKGYVDRIMVSNTEVASEAMKQFLIDNGVDESVIEIDATAVVTEDTCVAELNRYRGERSVIFISHGYHLPRIVYACKHIGVTGVGFPAESLKLIDRIKLPWFATQRIRYTRSRREAELLVLRMLNIYKPTIEIEK